jgi:hypothetical protein
LQHGVRLNLRSRLLFDEVGFYLNGRPMRFSPSLAAREQSQMQRLANTRHLSDSGLKLRLLQRLYPYWRSGEIEICN